MEGATRAALPPLQKVRYTAVGENNNQLGYRLVNEALDASGG